MSGYDPVSIRLQRETQRGMGSPVPFATVCIGLNIPSDLHSRLLRWLVDAGYVTEIVVGRVLVTASGIAQIAAQRA